MFAQREKVLAVLPNTRTLPMRSQKKQCEPDGNFASSSKAQL